MDMDKACSLKEGAGHNEFIRCNVHGNGDAATYHNHDLYVSSDSNLFDNCDIHDNIAWGMHIFSENDGTADNNIVRNSRIYNNGLLSSNDGTAGMIIGSGSEVWRTTMLSGEIEME